MEIISGVVVAIAFIEMFNCLFGLNIMSKKDRKEMLGEMSKYKLNHAIFIENIFKDMRKV